NQDPINAASADSGFESDWHPSQKSRQHEGGLNSNHAVVRARHSKIGNIGSAAGKNLFIGRLHVSVSSNHYRDSSVEVATHRHLFRSSLGVMIDNYDRCPVSDL